MQGGEYGSRPMFAAASSPPHLPMHPRGRFKSSPDASPLVDVHPTAVMRQPDRRPPLSTPLACRQHPHRRRRESPPLPRHGDRTAVGSGACVWPCHGCAHCVEYMYCVYTRVRGVMAPVTANLVSDLRLIVSVQETVRAKSRATRRAHLPVLRACAGIPMPTRRRRRT